MRIRAEVDSDLLATRQNISGECQEIVFHQKKPVDTKEDLEQGIVDRTRRLGSAATGYFRRGRQRVEGTEKHSREATISVKSA